MEQDAVWKEKYLASVEKQELSQKQWDDQERLLRVAISRVTLAAQGDDEALNTLLNDLRKATRSTGNFDAIQSLVDDISVRVKRLDGARERADGGETEAASPGQSPGFFGRLFGSKAVVPEQTAGQRAAPAGDGGASAQAVLFCVEDALRGAYGEQPALVQLRERIAATQERLALLAVARELARLALELAPSSGAAASRVLLDLLDTLNLPAELGAEVDALKDRLEQGDAETAVGDIADVVARMRRRMEAENVELQEFLRQLTDRLQEIDRHLEGARSQHQAVVEIGRQLGDKVEAQVRGIEDSVQTAQEIRELKAVIQSRLDNIRAHLDEHRRADVEREGALSKQLDEVNARLKIVEAEGEQLRESLREKHAQAMHDSLTGLHNRLAYDERVAQEHNRWKRYASPLVMAVLDIDRFKLLNDTYGHKAGDKALRLIATILKDNLRETDFLARYGGEEFVVLMPETDIDHAQAAAEKLRHAVEHCQFHYQGTRVPITISCGMAAFQTGDDADLVFKRADQALYGAKEAGRNQCRVAG